MRFREILEMMERKERLRDDGISEIVRKVYAMNPASKGRARSRPLDQALAGTPRPYVGRPNPGIKIWSSPHGDMGDELPKVAKFLVG